MRRHVEVKDLPSTVPENDEAVEQPKRDRVDNEEVAGSGAVHVVLEEGSPRLRRWPGPASNHVPRYGRFRDVVAQ